MVWQLLQAPVTIAIDESGQQQKPRQTIPAIQINRHHFAITVRLILFPYRQTPQFNTCNNNNTLLKHCVNVNAINFSTGKQQI